MAAGPDTNRADPMRVVIAGGGVAGLEAALALRDLAGGRVSIELLAPHLNFVIRPMTVLEPFGDTVAERFALSEILRDSEVAHRLDSVTWVDRIHRDAHTRSGHSIRYDALLLCPGAVPEPSFPRAITISCGSKDAGLAGLIADIDAGAVERVAFVVPSAPSWQLPLYELALLTATRARDRDLNVTLAIFTPEHAPLEAFGNSVGGSARALLAEAGIDLVCRVFCRVPESRSLLVDSVESRRWPRTRPSRQERAVKFDRIVALPRLRGPRIRGVPAAGDGFIPVDPHGRILGAHVEFAAGDATTCPLKHGSLAAQQADAAARMIAVLAGADVRPSTFHAVARGILVTGRGRRRLSASIVG